MADLDGEYIPSPYFEEFTFSDDRIDTVEYAPVPATVDVTVRVEGRPSGELPAGSEVLFHYPGGDATVLEVLA